MPDGSISRPLAGGPEGSVKWVEKSADRQEDKPDIKAGSLDLSPFVTLTRWFRQAVAVKSESSLKEALEEVFEEHVAGDSRVSDEETTLLRNMLHFSALCVGDVMIQRPDICAVPDRISFEDMKAYMVKEMHTRIPVYHETLDHVLGFLHMKDFFRCMVGEVAFDIRSLLRDILFVPRSMRIVDLLVKMRMNSCHIAIVIDEYGGTDGLVTMEDLFEEIVGEIQDEHDETDSKPAMVWQSDRILEADARVKIEDLEAEIKRQLVEDRDDADFDTLGGLIFSHLGRIPAKGEVVDYQDGLKLVILAADPRRVKKVRLIYPHPVASEVDA